MQNGYFQIVSTVGGGYGIKFYPPVDGGENVKIGELVSWLDGHNISYELGALKQFLESGKEITCHLGRGECPIINESYKLDISEDQMQAVVRFYPPSEGGERLTINDFLSDLRYKKIVSGIQMPEVQEHFQSEGIYGTDLVVAKGKPARNGKDAEIEYLFNTDMRVRPTMKEDGSVDYFNLNVINHCYAGDVLARIIPEDEGEYGMDIMGNRIKPRDVKKAVLKYTNYVELSEDKMSISSKVDGHVMLVDDKVFVSNIYEVENVDISTGNVEFNGSVQVNGNVASNFSVHASGNVIINGVVEGAHIVAGGNIIIARGMNGMSKGVLEAGGNIVAKFIESATVCADKGYVSAGSILHSDVTAGDEIVVDGKRGFLVGGHARAANKICVKTLGAEMGAATVVEVGVNPALKREYNEIQKQVMDLMKEIKNAQPILVNFAEKRSKGATFTPEQLSYIKGIAKQMEANKLLLIQKNSKLQDLQEIFTNQKRAAVEVTNEVYPGTTIVIGDVSTTIQSSYKYCRFVREQGEVRMGPL